MVELSTILVFLLAVRLLMLERRAQNSNLGALIG